MEKAKKQTGRYRNLFGNMALFTIGNFVSKLLVMLLVPFYTNVLSTAEYGIADGMQATLLLLVPLLTINIGEAALRYGIEREKERISILRIMVKYVLLSDTLVFGICTILYFILSHSGFVSGVAWGTYCMLFAALYVCNSIYEAMILYCQGCEQVKIMITGTVACTVLVIASNIYFLLILKIGLYGYLLAQMISFLGASLIMLCLMIFVTPSELLNAKEKDDGVLKLEKEMTGYGSSMLLYSTSSWVNNALDRYFVLAMCGAGVNGLYAVAYKIPAILTVFQRIFAQAWQISANKTYEDKDSADFFSKVYESYQTVMAIGCSGLILFTQLIAYLLFAKDFYQAYTLVPPLLISVIFGALTGFLGSICLAFKDGKSMGCATGIGAIVNAVLNAILIYFCGAMGAAIATMISYFTMYYFAYRAVLKHVALKINRKKDAVAYALLLAQAAAIMSKCEWYLAVEIPCFLIILYIYGSRFIGILRERKQKKDNQ